MTPGEFIQDAVGVGTILGFVIVGGRWLLRKLNKSREREIDERLQLVLQRREREQREGSPIEKELRRQLDEIKQELREVRELHRSEIADMRAEHDRELDDVRRQLTTEIDVLRGQLTEAYRSRPNKSGTEL